REAARADRGRLRRHPRAGLQAVRPSPGPQAAARASLRPLAYAGRFQKVGFRAMTAPAPTTRLGIIGAGAIGRGWAALAASHGWPVAIFDTDVKTIDAAMEEIRGRVKG